MLIRNSSIFYRSKIEMVKQQVQHLTRGVAGREEGRLKEAEGSILCL